MEAKDSVRLCPTTEAGWRINCSLKCHTTQAEISFKAGKQVGIREVVGWIGNNGTDSIAVKNSDTAQKMNIRAIPDELWQAKLKEWGVE